MIFDKQQQTPKKRGGFLSEAFKLMGLGTEENPVPVFDGFSLDKDLKGEIIAVTLAPNESKIISHGLRSIPQYRLILRQTGNGVVTDVDQYWTDKTIGLKNESANALVLKIKIFPG